MSTATLTSAVADAIADVRRAFPGAQLVESPDGTGGAFVIVEPVELGEAFAPQSTWLGFYLSPMLPDADVYPLYVGGDVTRADRSPLANPAIQAMTWRDRAALQLSRRSNRRDAAVSTPALKASNVVAWLRAL